MPLSDRLSRQGDFRISIPKLKRGYFALVRMEHHLTTSRFLVGDRVSLADASLLAYTRVAHEGGFHLDGYASIRRWIADSEKALGLV